MAKSPRWLALAQEVLDSLGTDARSDKSNRTTKRLMERCMVTLLSKKDKPLSAGQAAQFIENIKRRTRPTFKWDHDIVLTRDQLYDGRKAYPQFAPLTDKDATVGVSRDEYLRLLRRLEQLEALIPTETQPIPDSIPTQSRLLGQLEGPAAAENCDKVDPIPDVTERNGTEHNESMGRAVAPHGMKGKRKSPQVTIWVKEDKSGTPKATGYLETSGERYALYFTNYDHAIERTNGVSSDAWRDQFHSTYGEALRHQEASGNGIEAKATTTALFAASDSFARKPPVLADHAVALTWADGKPQSAVLVDAQHNWCRFDFRQESNERFKAALCVTE